VLPEGTSVKHCPPAGQVASVGSGERGSDDDWVGAAAKEVDAGRASIKWANRVRTSTPQNSMEGLPAQSLNLGNIFILLSILIRIREVVKRKT
jgi:hypothetical protein